MIPVSTFKARKVALFGLGGSGLATAQALVAGGAQVVAFDDGEAGRAKAVASRGAPASKKTRSGAKTTKRSTRR